MKKEIRNSLIYFGVLMLVMVVGITIALLRGNGK
jgi:hypothetical protein